jgi:hypothetical protein
MARQEIREGAAGLERAGVLQLFELERQREWRQPEIGAADLDDGRATDVRRDNGVDALDVGSADGQVDGGYIVV